MLRKALITTGFGGVLFIAVYLVLGALAPDYSSAHQTISDIEFTTFSIGQRANFLVFGLLLIAFAVALKRELSGGRAGHLIPLFQCVAGVAVIGDAVYIHMPLHLVCDLVAFIATLIVLFLFAWRFRCDRRWRGWAAYSIATAFLMMLFLTAFGLANHPGGLAGVYEKLATAVRTVWSVVLTARLLAGARLAEELPARLPV
ncbi:MAG TPA: DUF998 domain-containing protein [Terracidiphilus sp.]|nr:DUF998 domain-containing protein [Terracidiphilus sp.]